MKIDEFITRHSDRILIAGKVVGVLLLFFWGAFFLEHLSWFTTGKGMPPLSVILSVVLHGVMLTGYIVFLFSCRHGSYIILISAALFFFTILPVKTALIYFLLSAVPSLLWGIIYFAGLCAEKRKETNKNSETDSDVR